MKGGDITPLQPGDLDADPLRQFVSWFREAEQAGVPLANAMTLATSNRHGRPSARIVLLKAVDERGLVFFSNYQSRKAQELVENPLAALVFNWLAVSRQVRVEGAVEPLEAGESDVYFASRPRGHQLEAHASPQSQVILDRDYLERQFEAMARRFDGQTVPRPGHWGGYRVVPEVLEFWQEGDHRLHDRLRYRRGAAGAWLVERLAP